MAAMSLAKEMCAEILSPYAHTPTFSLLYYSQA